jgi:hypothetical protein
MRESDLAQTRSAKNRGIHGLLSRRLFSCLRIAAASLLVEIQEFFFRRRE